MLISQDNCNSLLLTRAKN